MVVKIPVDDLLPETRKKLRLKSGDSTVKPKIVALGKILQDTQGLTNREALWALRSAINHIKGFRQKGSESHRRAC